MTFHRQPMLTQSDADQKGGAQALAFAPEQLGRLRDKLAEYSGVYLDSSRYRLLENSLAERLAATGDDLAAYERRLHSSEEREELRRLAELVLNHETVFFRNGPHLRALREVLVPEVHRRKPAGEPIRIWSAGCSTGEEAYSLAIVMREVFNRPLARPIEIWATDLSAPALQKAREGVYRGRALQNVSPELLARYFKPRQDAYVVGDALREIVRFEALNLLDPFPKYAHGVDMIFCQNVTIYFQLKTCQQLVGRFYDCLPAGGLLFLGFSETLWNVFDRFHSREVAGAYVYYKGTLETPRPAATPSPPRRAAAAAQPSVPANLPRRPALAAQAPAPAPQLSDDQATLAQGRALFAQGKADQALEALRRLSPQSACATQALTLIARAHADRGDLELAAAEVQRAIEIDTLNDDAYLLLGMIYGRQGQWQAAIQQLERARYLSPDAALVSFHLAEAYRQAGRADKAVREYRNTLRKLDGHPPGALLDGVAVGWLRETCQRQIGYVPRPR